MGLDLFPAESPLGRLMRAPARAGRVEWIGVRAVRRAAPTAIEGARLVAGRGLEGDHYETRRNGPRQATLIAAEDLAAAASFLGVARLDPGLLRRNIVVRGINLMALKGWRFRVGGALLEWTGECEPCSRMEANLGPGAWNALRGRGGITARILESGEARIGDAVARADAEA